MVIFCQIFFFIFKSVLYKCWFSRNILLWGSYSICVLLVPVNVPCMQTVTEQFHSGCTGCVVNMPGTENVALKFCRGLQTLFTCLSLKLWKNSSMEGVWTAKPITNKLYSLTADSILCCTKNAVPNWQLVFPFPQKKYNLLLLLGPLCPT